MIEDLYPDSAEEDCAMDYFPENDSLVNASLNALEVIKNIELSHMEQDIDENYDGDFEYSYHEESDGTIEFNFPAEIKIIETALKQNQALMRAHPLNIKNNQALEIIKKKIISLTNFTVIKKPGEKNYYYTVGDNWDENLYLSQEEYDLLKEVLL